VDAAASASLRRCRLAPVLQRPQLRLNYLFARTGSHLDHALIIFFAGL
jgi:hypothetical protein